MFAWPYKIISNFDSNDFRWFNGYTTSCSLSQNYNGYIDDK